MPPNTTLDTYTDHLDIAAEDVGDVAAAIRTLARLHGVSGELEPIDVFARAASRLADADVDLEPIERLLLGLSRFQLVDQRGGLRFAVGIDSGGMRHGWQISGCSERRTARRLGGSCGVAGSWGGGQGARCSADAGGLDQSADR